MALEGFANTVTPSDPSIPACVLTSAIDASTLTIPISVATFLPASGTQYRIRIGDELIPIASRSGLTLTASSRGEGSTAVVHVLGASVYCPLTALGLARNPRSMTTTGDMEYLNASGAPTRLAAGTLGYVLTSGGPGVAPAWAAVTGTGDVVGPSSSVDNAIVRYDSTTGKLVQGYTSGAPTISDTGNLTLAAGSTGSATFLQLAVSDNGAVGQFSFCIGQAANIGDGTRADHVVTQGWNTKPLGGQAIAGEPTFEQRYESYYNPGAGINQMEFAYQYYDPLGAGFRPMQIEINRTNGGYLTLATLDIKATGFSYLTPDATQYAKFSAAQLELFASTIVTSRTNNVQWLQQKNAAGSGSVTIAYLNASDVVALGGANGISMSGVSTFTGGMSLPGGASFSVEANNVAAIRQRNAANSAYVNLLLLNASDVLVLGAATGVLVTGATTNAVFVTPSTVTGGNNSDGGGAGFHVGPASLTTGATLYGGRWSSGDRGARLVGVSSGGSEATYVHVNGETSNVSLVGTKITFTGACEGLTFGDAKNVVFNTTTGTKIGTAITQKIGFFNATPVVQQTRGATLTNSVTSGGVDDTIANFSDLTTYATDAAAIRNNIYQLARIVRQHDVALRALGLES